MSSGTLFVRFPDGEVRFGIYHGTCDIAYERLVSTPAEAWEARETGGLWWREDTRPEAVNVEPVTIATNYGGGFWWLGSATKDMLVDGLQPYGDEWDGSGHKEMHDGLPDWADRKANV